MNKLYLLKYKCASCNKPISRQFQHILNFGFTYQLSFWCPNCSSVQQLSFQFVDKKQKLQNLKYFCNYQGSKRRIKVEEDVNSIKEAT